MADIVKKKVTVTKKMYGWSKYGGARRGMVKEELEVWYCQCCSEEQTKEMPEYYIAEDDDEREFMRVCGKCRHVIKKHNVTFIGALMSLTRIPEGIAATFYGRS